MTPKPPTGVVSPKSNRQQPLPIKIIGTGAYLPRQTVLSSAFDARWAKPEGWTAAQCGVEQRHIASPGESSSTMAAEAAKAAISAADIDAQQLDCIVSACSVMEQAIPCLASQVQNRLGLGDSGIPAYDINATCLSFLVALDQLACAMVAGRYRRVLVVSSEMPSIGLNPDDRATAPLFGDGAAAAVLERLDPASTSAYLASHFETYGSGSEYCRFRAGGTGFWGNRSATPFPYFEMDGRALFRLASRQLPGFMDRLMGKAKMTLDDIALVVPHQASGRALAHLQAILGISSERMIQVIGRQGNQVAASLPSALHHAVSSGRLQRSQYIALLGAGAGVSLGGAILRY